MISQRGNLIVYSLKHKFQIVISNKYAAAVAQSIRVFAPQGVGGISNPNHDRPTLIKEVKTSPMPNACQQVWRA